MSKCCFFWTALAFIVSIIALQSSSRFEPIDTQDWGLADFVSHLHSAGLDLKIVPTRKSGEWGDSIYLSEDPAATWLAFQVKKRNVENIEEWQGAVWVERLRCSGDTEGYNPDWGSNGFQIGRFVVFGDTRLVERIIRALQY